MEHREDLRVIKTKMALHNAFFTMLSEMSMEDITVNNLCERAGVRRATFYKHFNDKLDFITYLIQDIRGRFDAEFQNDEGLPSLTVDYYVKYVAALGAFFTKHEKAISKILNSPMQASFIGVFMQRNFLDTQERLERSAANGMMLPAEVSVVASMLTGGIAHCILRWFETENRPSIDSLLIEISKFTQAVLNQKQ